MPTVLPSDKQLTGLQCRHASSGRSRRDAEGFKISCPLGRDGHLVERVLRRSKHDDSKRKGHGESKSLCSLHAVPLDSRGEVEDEGAIKILQINYTKKKRQIIYKKNLYKAFTLLSSFVRTLHS